jgi:EAL domain-containing protein (putative c-di-GMP-specific phosphodiesterase class I)
VFGANGSRVRFVDLDRHEIIGYEALVRWEHPTEGELPPGEFIPLAEETGLIVTLGEWVLTEACMEATRLCRLHGRQMHMSVNVSARQLHHPDFLRHVQHALDKSALTPSLLTLELTESTLLTSDERVAKTLETIRGPRSRPALDDFGRATHRSRTCASSRSTSSRSTGATPTSRAGRRPRAAQGHHRPRKHALQLNLVAEGIETSEQHTIVRRLGCQQARGSILAGPHTRLSAISTRSAPSSS